MDNAPPFDSPDTFNPSYLRLADIDGSGTTDVIYLRKNDFRIWLNHNGNAWTLEPQVINAFPAIHDLADVAGWTSWVPVRAASSVLRPLRTSLCSTST